MQEPEHPAHCSYEGCTRPVHGDTDKCIFHAPADKKDPQEFRNALARQIREWRNEKAQRWDFVGWVFVDVDRNMNSESLPSEFNLFCRAVFPVNADFRESIFESQTCFDSSEFVAEADFKFAQFIGHAYFTFAKFKGNAWFNDAKFKCGATFSSAQFMGAAAFNATLCTGIMDFMFAQFKEYASFRSAQFAGQGWFNSAQFISNAYFDSAAFSGYASFESVKFYKESVFKEASFKETLDLTYAAFAILGDFTDCKILGHAQLLWPGKGKARIEVKEEEREKSLTAAAEIQRGKLLLKDLDTTKGILDLRDNSLAPDCELAIEECDMSRVLLRGTDCTKIRFYNCRWPVALGRRMVGDERVARSCLKRKSYKRFGLFMKSIFHKRRKLFGVFRKWDPDWRLIELTYQQLAKRFREDFNHSTANDFDCGVFVMRRMGGYQREFLKGKRWRTFQKRWLSLVALYRYLSNYSVNFWLPLMWLGITIISCGIGYRLFTRPNIHDCCLWNFLDDLGLSLQVSYLNRSGLDFARGNSIGVNVLMAMQVVFTATLVALFIFAVRRRFRHG